MKQPRGFNDVDAQMNIFKNKKIDLLFVVISGQGDSYSRIKQSAELKCGILTQCIKAFTIQKKCGDISTIRNILLKVNAKLNGINHKIALPSKPPIMKQTIMYLGADVTHPPPGSSKPSVAGITASFDAEAFQYNICWRLQDPTQEMIQDMENIIQEQLKFFKEKRGCMPDKIIYYRDGVSDGQFPQLRDVELVAIDRGCKRVRLI